MYILYSLISPLIGLAIFVLIVRAVIHAFRKNKKTEGVPKSIADPQSLFFDKDDGFSQLYFFLSLLFFYLFLYNFNKAIGAPLTLEYIFLISTALTFVVSYLVKSIFLLPFGVVGLYTTTALFVNSWLDNANGNIALFSNLVIFILLSLVLYALGRIHDINPKFKRYGLAYIVISLFPIGGFLFYFSSYQGLHLLQDVAKTSIYNSWQISSTVLFFSLLVIVVSIYGIIKKVIQSFEIISAAIFFVVILALTFLKLDSLFMTQTASFNTSNILDTSGVVWLFLFNVLLFTFISGFIVLGYIRRESWAINVGSALFVLFFIVKYVQFLVDSLSRSLLFIVGGVLLLVMGYVLSKGRQKLLDSIKTTNV